MSGLGHNLNQIQTEPNPDQNFLALGKNTPDTGNRQFTQNNERGHIDFTAAIDTTNHPRKKTPS